MIADRPTYSGESSSGASAPELLPVAGGFRPERVFYRDAAEVTRSARHQRRRSVRLRRWLAAQDRVWRWALARHVVLAGDVFGRLLEMRRELFRSRVLRARLAEVSAYERVAFDTAPALPRLQAMLPVAGTAQRDAIELEIREVAGIVVVGVRGVLSFETAPILAEAIQVPLERAHTIVDLAASKTTDVSAYRELERCHHYGHQRGRLLVLAAPPRRIRVLIEALHLDERIAVFDSIEDALESLRDVNSPASAQSRIVPVMFRLPGSLAPQARRVSVAGSFNGWDATTHPLEQTPKGDWMTTAYLPAGRILYCLWVEGFTRLDPFDDGRTTNEWGAECSVRYVGGRGALAEPQRELRPVRGGAQDHLFRCHNERLPDAPVTILRPTGEIDLSTEDHFLEALSGPFAEARHTIVDLGAVRYIDSTGFHALIDAHRRSARRGLRLTLAAPAQDVARIMDVLGLTRLIPCFPTVEAALASERNHDRLEER